MWQTTVQTCMGSSEKFVRVWFQSTYKIRPDVSSVIALLTLELEETQTFFQNLKKTEFLCIYCLNASFSFSFQVSNVGEDNLRNQLISYLLLKALSQCLLKFLLFPLSLHIVLLQPVNLPLGAFWSFVFLIFIKIFSYLSEIGRTWGITKYSLYFSGSSVCYQLSPL